MSKEWCQKIFVNALEWAAGLDPVGKPPGAEEALNLFRLPADLAVDLIASEPVVAQPSFLNFDERGRLWVMQYRQYPRAGGTEAREPGPLLAQCLRQGARTAGPSRLRPGEGPHHDPRGHRRRRELSIR